MQVLLNHGVWKNFQLLFSQIIQPLAYVHFGYYCSWNVNNQLIWIHFIAHYPWENIFIYAYVRYEIINCCMRCKHSDQKYIKNYTIIFCIFSRNWESIRVKHTTELNQVHTHLNWKSWSLRKAKTKRKKKNKCILICPVVYPCVVNARRDKRSSFIIIVVVLHAFINRMKIYCSWLLWLIVVFALFFDQLLNFSLFICNCFFFHQFSRCVVLTMV